MNQLEGLERYNILSTLGEGGMGKVYLAHDKRLNRKVAIKTIRTRCLDSKHVLQRTIREGEILAGLSHFGLVPLYEVNMKADVPYIVQGYVEGESLGDLILSGRLLSEDQVWDLLKEQADVLAYIHKQGLVHRDIKPDNIMIDKDGKSILMDFGLALDDNRTRLTADGMFVGTMLYCPPELFSMNGKARPSSDIYQLGLVAYEALTGENFMGDFSSSKELIEYIIVGDWEARRFPEFISSHMGKIISACCRYNVSDRIKDGTTLLKIIESDEERLDRYVRSKISKKVNDDSFSCNDSFSNDKSACKNDSFSNDKSVCKGKRGNHLLQRRKQILAFVVTIFFILCFAGFTFNLWSDKDNHKETGQNIFTSARGWFLTENGFYLLFPHSLGDDLSWKLVISDNHVVASSNFVKMPRGWEANVSLTKEQRGAKEQVYDLCIFKNDTLIGSTQVMLPDEIFKQPFRVRFSFKRIEANWELYGHSKVIISFALTGNNESSKQIEFLAKGGRCSWSFPQEWNGKEIACAILLPDGTKRVVSRVAGFSKEHKHCSLYDENTVDELDESYLIKDKLYLLSKNARITCLSISPSSFLLPSSSLSSSLSPSSSLLNTVYESKVYLTEEKRDKNFSPGKEKPLRFFKKQKADFISLSAQGVAIWGASDGTDVIYINHDGTVSRKKIAPFIKKMHVNSKAYAVSNEATLFSGAATLMEGNVLTKKVLLILHMMKDDKIVILEQNYSKYFPRVLFYFDGTFWGWYAKYRVNLSQSAELTCPSVNVLYKIYLSKGKLKYSKLEGFSPSVDSSKFKYVAVDKDKQIALLADGRQLYYLKRENDELKLRTDFFKLDSHSLVSGVCSLGEGKFCVLVTEIRPEKLGGVDSLRQPCLLYIDFEKTNKKPSVSRLDTKGCFATVTPNCDVAGMKVIGEQICFTYGSSFYIYDFNLKTVVYNSMFFSSPNNLLTYRDNVFVVDNSCHSVMVLQTDNDL